MWALWGAMRAIHRGLPVGQDAPKAYSPHKTHYNRLVGWSRMGMFEQVFACLAGEAGKPDRLMVHATHLKAHRTAASLHKRGSLPALYGHGPTVRPDTISTAGGNRLLAHRHPSR